MRDYRDSDLDEFDYSRPSLSAWVAVGAAAVAVFMAGGLVKTYRQLEEVREENRKEIQELRQTVRTLRESGQVVVPNSGTRGRPPRTQPLPGTSRPTGARPRSDAAAARPIRPPSAGAEPIPSLPDTQSGEDKGGTKVSFGRKSPEDPYAALRANLQVISVSNDHKRVIIEGGRNIEIAEGARLKITRAGAWIGDLRVLDVYADQSACEIIHATRQPAPGDKVTF